MISLTKTHLTPPSKFTNDKVKKRYYLNVYDSSKKIKPRWNTIQEDGKVVIRQYLSTLSNCCCSYCGRKVTGSDMEVDHFLPSHHFPYLSYCLDNLLPSCGKCNGTYKHAFIPNTIENLIIVEKCMEDDVEYHHIYDKNEILNQLCGNDRIIDPTFDCIEDHLEFNPEFYLYTNKTIIGTNTNEMFFNRMEFIAELEQMSFIVRKLIEGGGTNDLEVVESLIKWQGYEFYYRKFYEYWLNEKANNRL